jgi:hypothetical protein
MLYEPGYCHLEVIEQVVGLDRLGRPVQNRSARKEKKANGRGEPGLAVRWVWLFGLDWVSPVEFGLDNPARWI